MRKENVFLSFKSAFYDNWGYAAVRCTLLGLVCIPYAYIAGLYRYPPGPEYRGPLPDTMPQPIWMQVIWFFAATAVLSFLLWSIGLFVHGIVSKNGQFDSEKQMKAGVFSAILSTLLWITVRYPVFLESGLVIEKRYGLYSLVIDFFIIYCLCSLASRLIAGKEKRVDNIQ